MGKDRYGQLKPPQITAAIASFPRRYREALSRWIGAEETASDEDTELDAGTVALVNDTVRTIAMCDRAIELTLSRDNPAVPAAVGDAGLREWAAPAPEDLAPLVDELDDLCSVLAGRLAAASGDDWGRTAVIAGSGQSTRTTELAQAAVRTGAENLRRLVP